MIFYVEFTKKLILFFLFTPRFFVPNFINVANLFLRIEGGGEVGANSLKQTYVGGVYVKRTGQTRWGGGSKFGNFKQMYFLNAHDNDF